MKCVNTKVTAICHFSFTQLANITDNVFAYEHIRAEQRDLRQDQREESFRIQ